MCRKSAVKADNTVASCKLTMKMHLAFLREEKEKALAETAAADFSQKDVILFMTGLR
jgi:hypothetical protein